MNRPDPIRSQGLNRTLDGIDPLQRPLQRRQIARSGPACGHFGCEPLQIGHAFQLIVEGVPDFAGLVKGLHAVQTLPDRFQLFEGPLYPCSQSAASHGRGRAVQYGQQGALPSARDHGSGDFQIPPRGRIQDHEFPVGVGSDSADVIQAGFLGVLKVIENGSGSAQARPHVLASESFQGSGAEMVQQGFTAGFTAEKPVFAFGGRSGLTVAADALEQGFRPAFRQNQFCRVDGFDFLQQPVQRTFGDHELAGGYVRGRESGQVAVHRDGGQVIVARRFEQVLGRDRARSDDLNHLPFHDALGQFGIFHLFADRHPVSGPDHLVQIAVEGVMGKSGQRDVSRLAVPAAGERDP